MAGRVEGLPVMRGQTMKNLQSLMAAYLFVWGIFFVYHLTVAQRLARLQDEVKRLKEMLKRA